MRVFVYAVTLTLKANRTNMFDNVKTQFIVCVGTHIIYAETTDLPKATESCFSPYRACAD
jgi:hypothetical protein